MNSGEEIIFKNLGVEVNQDDILSRFGSGKHFFKKFYHSNSEKIANKIKPLGICKVLNNDPSYSNRYELPYPLKRADYLVLCLATIGGELEDWVEKLKEGGEVSKAMFIDRLGSHAVSNLARKLGDKVKIRLKKEDLTLTRAFEPGSGSSGWDLKNQQIIFRNISSKRIGVKLTDSYTITPKKTVSYVIGAGREIEETQFLFSCIGCPRKDCEYRTIPEKKDV